MSSRTSAQSSSKSRKLTQLNSIRVPRTLALGLVLLISSALAGAQTSPPGVFGTWNLNYDWLCSGTYVQATITFNPNGTFSDSQGLSGIWSSHDTQILFQYNNSSHTTYEGSIVESAVVGISSTFNGGQGGQSGCWYAIKTTATAKPSAEGTQELTISGEPRK
jgi:hypothetical protein